MYHYYLTRIRMYVCMPLRDHDAGNPGQNCSSCIVQAISPPVTHCARPTEHDPMRCVQPSPAEALATFGVDPFGPPVHVSSSSSLNMTRSMTTETPLLDEAIALQPVVRDPVPAWLIVFICIVCVAIFALLGMMTVWSKQSFELKIRFEQGAVSGTLLRIIEPIRIFKPGEKVQVGTAVGASVPRSKPRTPALKNQGKLKKRSKGKSDPTKSNQSSNTMVLEPNRHF